MKLSRLIALMGAAALFACSETTSSGAANTDNRRTVTENRSRDDGNPLDEMFRKQNEAKRRRADQKAELDSDAASLPDGWKEKFERWWKMYQQNDAKWPEARREWLALGPPAPVILTENLLRAYIFAGEGSSVNADAMQRAQVELVDLRKDAISIMVIGLASGFGDGVVRDRFTDLLAHMGADIIPVIEREWPGAKPAGQRELTRALKKYHEPPALPMLSRIATSDADFQARLDALEGLGFMGDPSTAPVFRTCMGDADRSVRKFAAFYARGLKSRAPVEALVACMERATASGEADVADAALGTLRIATGRRLSSDPAEWRAALKSGGR